MDFIYRRSYRGPLQAVILDWAGTAVDFGSFAPTAVFLRLFESRGVKITADDARSGMGLMKKDHLRTILARPAVAEIWKVEHGYPASEADIDHLFNDFVPMQTSVLKEFATPIPGLLSVVKELREQGLKIGTTTGYLRAMMEVLAPQARKNGYEPDCIFCPDEVIAGRPFPWMCYENAIRLGVYPMQAMVKVGDTLVDIEEGLNAGMWTVGLSMTGNLLGLTHSEYKALSKKEKTDARKKTEPQLYQSGAHFVIDGIWDLPKVLEDINFLQAQGERP
ncbi:phosphonoacetaldehyde hydrolase [Candidatus Villigracilis saccharophilus]|uniref:phosphonoacetaldehyde hydrolase n=1 Tax=Candidatus Villigracilis saccharophilus TaxID=3140684 RepID=UPI00313624B1|nr:phosphonoacetaldehyde hydrolase [Anaerolineales bacterium]